MGWFSTYRRLTGWLALVALAIQLVVSFGHIHPEDVGRGGARDARTVAATDAPNEHPDRDHLTCNVCATVRLSSTALQPAAPALPVPAVFTTAALPAPAPQATAPVNAASFRARGPPRA